MKEEIDEWLLWSRLKDDCKLQIQQAKATVYMSTALLHSANKHLQRLERAGKKPKFNKNAKPKIGIG